MPTLIIEGASDAESTLVLAPGAGAPKTSAWMTRVSALLAEAGLRVVRFDFDYMAARETGSRRPPPKAEALVAEYDAAVVQVVSEIGDGRRRLLIGGKSLGGRVASLAAQSLFERGRIAGLVCLSYPFHPPKRPEQLRTRHLKDLTCPTLIVQGERDPFGTPPEVAGYALSPAISLHWARDGDHDLEPRRASGATLEANLRDAAAAVARFAQTL